MAQYHVTIDSELLQQLFLSDAKDAGMARLLQSVLNQVLEAQATEQLRAEPYERTEERLGYRKRDLPSQPYHQGRNDYLKGSKAQKRQIFDRVVFPVPAQ